VPEPNQYDAMLHLVKAIMTRRESSKAPIVVHCRYYSFSNFSNKSAGVGRTGTLISIHNLAQIIKRYQRMIANGDSIYWV